MRSFDGKISIDDFIYLCKYYGNVIYDLEVIKENYYKLLNKEEKQTIDSSLDALLSSLEDIKIKYDIKEFFDRENTGFDIRFAIFDVKHLQDYKDKYLHSEIEDFFKPIFTKTFEIEEKCKPIASKIWQQELSDVTNFNNKNYGFLVYKITERSNTNFLSFRKYLTDVKSRRLSTTYINPNDTKTFFEYKSDYGLIYKLTPKNFLGGCVNDAYSTEYPTIKAEYTFAKSNASISDNKKIYSIFEDGEQQVFSGLEFKYGKDYATQTITPKRMELRSDKEHYNEVVLDYLNSKPCAVFYFYYGHKFITSCNMAELKSISEYYNVPIVAINRLENCDLKNLSDEMKGYISKSLANMVDIKIENYFSNEIDEKNSKVFNAIIKNNPETKEQLNETLKSIDYEMKDNDCIQDL